MSDLIDTTEMYLRTIYELMEDGVTPMRARIAEHLGHSGPTVSQTVARMERDGLVVVSEDRHLELTAEGLAIAVKVMRKHRLAERMLTDVIGLDLPDVHDEACRWEHVMSDQVERKILHMLEGPLTSPYGNPIPGLEELGMEASASDPQAAIALTEAVDQGLAEITLVRIGETPQTEPGFLADVIAVGFLPGTSATVTREGDSIGVLASSGAFSLERDIARHVFVTTRLAHPQ